MTANGSKEARQAKRAFWVRCYAEQRRVLRIWLATFLLLFALLGLLPLAALLIARYGR